MRLPPVIAPDLWELWRGASAAHTHPGHGDRKSSEGSAQWPEMLKIIWGKWHPDFPAGVLWHQAFSVLQGLGRDVEENGRGTAPWIWEKREAPGRQTWRATFPEYHCAFPTQVQKSLCKARYKSLPQDPRTASINQAVVQNSLNCEGSRYNYPLNKNTGNH